MCGFSWLVVVQTPQIDFYTGAIIETDPISKFTVNRKKMVDLEGLFSFFDSDLSIFGGNSLIG
jgi:hypothetical protein